jgi:hypothetical protein
MIVNNCPAEPRRNRIIAAEGIDDIMTKIPHMRLRIKLFFGTPVTT